MRLTSEHAYPQGDLGRLGLQVPQEELPRVTFLTPVHLEIQDLLAPMGHKVWDSPGKGWWCPFQRPPAL